MVTPTPEIVNKLSSCGEGVGGEEFLDMDEVSWYDVPAVQILGAVLGTLLLVAAVRSMFGKRK
jgi:hypothetical protein